MNNQNYKQMNNNTNNNVNHMDPTNFYAYVNTLINTGYSKYNAVIIFINDININENYKTIPEVQEELEHGLRLINNY
jgi:hypothetical protein